MHSDVENLGLDYDKLTNQALKLNQSYLDLLKLFDEVNLVPALLVELEKEGNSPLKVVDTMSSSQQALSKKFTDLLELITNTQSRFSSEPEVTELKAISHNCQVMQNFLGSMAMNDVKEMFVKLSNS